MTLSERTAAAIRQRILELTPGYGPADRLYPARLSEDLGVSITPIREALKILEVEGLVSVSPRRGARVSSVSEGELHDLQAVQSGLELLALDIMPDPSLISDVDDLATILADSDAALAVGDLAACRDLSDDFHRRIVSRARNTPLQNLYDLLLRQSLILELYYPRASPDVAASIDEHRRVIQAMKTGDVEKVRAALKRHWQGTGKRLNRIYTTEMAPSERGAPTRGSGSTP